MQYKILLPYVKKITIDYRNDCKDIGATFQFIRKYIADIRFNNPNIIIERNRTAEGPIKLKFTVTKNNGLEEFIDPSLCEGCEDIKNKL